MIGIPERHRIKKSLWVFVTELQSPGGAAVNRLVNARSGPVADAQNISGAFANRIDITKVQRVRRYPDLVPRRSTIVGPQHGAPRSAGPCDALTDSADATQTRSDAAGLQCPLRRAEHEHEYD